MNSAFRMVASICAICFLTSCGLLLEFPEEAEINCCPETENQVLSEQEIPYIRFDFPVNRYSVEALFSVKDAAGELPGFFRWEDRTLFFQPRPELIPGRRYLFSFVGTYEDLVGAEYSAHTIVPFYYKRRHEAAPYVLGSDPEPGSTIAAGAGLYIYFSEAIDPSSLVRGISAQPDTAFTANWDSGATRLVLVPEENWEHCQSLTIWITEDLKDSVGVPLAENREFVFWVQEDIVSPRVLMVEPGFNLPAELYPSTGRSIEEPVGLKDVLRIRFSEAMDAGASADALNLIPPVTSECIWIDATSLVVVPTFGFAAHSEYLLDFGSGTTDPAGNTIEMPEAIRFITVDATIKVSTELVQDGIQLHPEDYSTATAVEIRPYPISSSADYELVFRFAGAEFHSNAEKYTVQESISLLCIFPDSGIADPVATGYSWMGDMALSVTYSQLQPSTATKKVYYLLRIRGGTGGIISDDGFQLPQDIEQLLVTAVE